AAAPAASSRSNSRIPTATTWKSTGTSTGPLGLTPAPAGRMEGWPQPGGRQPLPRPRPGQLPARSAAPAPIRGVPPQPGFPAETSARYGRSVGYWGKTIGGVAAFAMGGRMGAVVGAALGHAADSGALPNMQLPFGQQAAWNPARVAAMFNRRDQLFAICSVV